MNKDLLLNNWCNCLKEIQKNLSSEDFSRWIKPIEASSYDGSVLLLAVPGEEWIQCIEKKFMGSMIPALQGRFEGIQTLRYTLNPEKVERKTELSSKAPSFNSPSNTQSIQNPFIIPGLKKILIDDPQLNFDYDFDNFVAGQCNNLARVTGLAVAKKPGEHAFNPFFIHGDSGMGKTHLAQAIGIEIKKNSPDVNVLYVSMNKFLDQFTTATRKKEVNNFVRFYQLIDVLIIDDIHELTGRPGTQSVLFSIFNHLHLTGKQLIFTCDRPPSELKDIENRLITRFRWGITVAVEKPDYETKVRIIQSKSNRLNLNLPEDVINYVAKSIDGSVREIEGAISSFVAYTTFLKREPSMALAKEIMDSLSPQERSRVKTLVEPLVEEKSQDISIEHIQNTICEYYGISKADFFSKKRTQDIAFARQLAMYLAKEKTTMSLKAIGKAVGGKTHATVLYAHKAVTNRLLTTKDFAEELQTICDKL